MPVSNCKINPENSDFSVGKFLTKKAVPCNEKAYRKLSSLPSNLFIIVLQVDFNSLLLNIDILLNEIFNIYIVLNNGLQIT